MELVLTRQEGSQVLVTCGGQPSHTFDVLALVPNEKNLPSPIDNPIAYGTALFQALFAPASIALQALEGMPERILLVAGDNQIDALPWEYAYGPDGFLVCETHFVRGLPQARIPAHTLDLPLHIVAVPSNPLEKDLPPLNIDGEWTRLKEIVQQLPYQVTLERTRPPTLEQLRNQVANQHHRIIHFMGHGGQDARKVLSCVLKKTTGRLFQ